jgi:hypothetical protein
MNNDSTNGRPPTHAKRESGGGAGSRRHLKGPPVEVFVYRMIYGRRGRGGKRTYIANVLLRLEFEVAYRSGPGVYRLEYRDARRWVVGVKLFRVTSNGQYGLVGRAKRGPGRRRFPPPWDGRAR